MKVSLPPWVNITKRSTMLRDRDFPNVRYWQADAISGMCEHSWYVPGKHKWTWWAVGVNGEMCREGINNLLEARTQALEWLSTQEDGLAAMVLLAMRRELCTSG